MLDRSTPFRDHLRYVLYAPVYGLFVRRLDAGRRYSLVDVRAGERVLVPGTELDFAPGMERAEAARLGTGISVRMLDAPALDLLDASFDAALSHLLPAVVPDPGATIREAARVPRPGGRVVVFDESLPDGERPPPSERRRASGRHRPCPAVRPAPRLGRARLVAPRHRPA